MAINVQYAPTASSMGGVAYLGGYGSFANDERRYQDQLNQRTAEMLQRERMQATQLQASALNQARQNQTALQQQMLGQMGRERLAVFGHQAGLQDRALQFQMQSQLGQQQTQQRDWLAQQQMDRQVEMERRALEERATFARQEAETRAQQINADAQRRIEAARRQMVAGQIRPQQFAEFERTMLDEASSQIAGVEWESQMPQGPTPKEELEQEWHNAHVMVDGQPLYRTEDGSWMVPRGWKPPEPEVPQGPTPEQQQQAQLQNQLADSFEQAVRKRADELGQFPKDGSKPLFADLTGRARSDALRRAAIEHELGRFGLTEVPQRHAGFGQPAGEAPPPQSSIPPEGAPAGGDVPPITPETAMPQAERDFQEREARRAEAAENGLVVPVFDGPTLEQGRQPVSSLAQLQDMPIPPDLRAEELLELGGELAIPANRGNLPADRVEAIQEFDKLFAQAPDTEAAKQAVNILSAAVAFYGVDPRYWPEEVLRETWQASSDMARLREKGTNKNG